MARLLLLLQVLFVLRSDGARVHVDKDGKLQRRHESRADNVFKSMDVDDDGSISREEFTKAMGVGLGKELADTLEIGDEKVPALFNLIDKDVSEGHSEAEIADALGMMEMARELHQRAAANSVAAEMETSVGGKVEDPRCKKEQGGSEGFNCLGNGTMIYCSAGKRLGNEASCGWQGRCKKGIMGFGGCDYPLCFGRPDGRFCRQGAGGSMVFQCRTRGAHHRLERESIRDSVCGVGQQCWEFMHGPPPTRRRRTWCDRSQNFNRVRDRSRNFNRVRRNFRCRNYGIGRVDRVGRVGRIGRVGRVGRNDGCGPCREEPPYAMCTDEYQMMAKEPAWSEGHVFAMGVDPR